MVILNVLKFHIVPFNSGAGIVLNLFLINLISTGCSRIKTEKQIIKKELRSLEERFLRF